MEDKKLDYIIHNVHCHIFTIDYLPKRFIGWYLPTCLVGNKWISEKLFGLAKRFAPRIAGFIYSALKKDQEEIFDELRGYYPKTAKFCPLTIDFDHMGAGNARKDYLQQLKDVATLRNKYIAKGFDVIYPFVCADPRRNNVLSIVKTYIEEEGFTGIKLYPALGFFPDDSRLDDVYKYAEENGIPITTHCIPKNKNHFRYKPTADMIETAKNRFKFYKKKDSRRSYNFAKYLNHPENYEYVLKKFPKLKINLAHFGGNEEWDKYLDVSDENFKKERNWYSIIRKLIAKHENAYSDISFTVYDDKLYPLLRNLLRSTKTKHKVLFGSDFYMLQKDYHERRFGLDVRGYLEDDEYWLIAEQNPKAFLEHNSQQPVNNEA